MRAATPTSARHALAAAAVASLALVGCGRLNRTATINQVTTTSGAATAAALQQHLASHGLPGAHVTCAKTVIVNVGTTTSCTLTGAGHTHTVRFTFNSSRGTVAASSVKVP